MGQPIHVVEKPTSTPGVARFEINRSLTGMGHERYASVDAIVDNRAVDELARRLFATGGVRGVHVNNAVITVELTEGWTGDRLIDVIRGLYIYYPDADTAGGSGDEASAEPTDTTESAETAALPQNGS